jgi:hypothetical protein
MNRGTILYERLQLLETIAGTMPNRRRFKTLILFILPNAADCRGASLRETVPDRNTKSGIGSLGRQQARTALRNARDRGPIQRHGQSNVAGQSNDVSEGTAG